MTRCKMTENDIYKMCELRCPACGIKYEGEMELMQEVKVSDKLFDACPHCGFLGDVVFLAFARERR